MHNESLKSNLKLEWFAQNDVSLDLSYHLHFLQRLPGGFNSHKSTIVDLPIALWFPQLLNSAFSYQPIQHEATLPP